MENSRQIVLRQSVKYAVALLFWLPVIFFSILLVRNTIPYFTFSNQFSFIVERAILFAKPFYRTCFYFHIFAGMFCISASLVQFSSYILRRRKLIHVWSGRIYVFVVLLIGAPTGLYMSFFAKGSFAERGLFMFMALYWFYATAKGLLVILKKNILAHQVWMIRSYCMAMTAVTFRIYHLLFFYFGWNHLENYEISLWISVIENIFFAEFIIWNKSKSYLNTFKN